MASYLILVSLRCAPRVKGRRRLTFQTINRALKWKLGASHEWSINANLGGDIFLL